MCFAPQRCALFRHLDFQKCSEHGVFCKFYLGNVATTAYVFSSSQLPKVLRSCCVLYMLTWKCASRHNGVHFFDIATSKSAPRMMCFVRLGFEICFEPQLRAIFHLISPDGSAPAASASLLFDTFRPFVAPKHWQNTVIRDFSAFSRACIFFLLTLSLLWFSCFFSSLLFSDFLASSLLFSSLIFLLLLFSSLIFLLLASSLLFSSDLFSSLLFSNLL